jgi:hypothetical protein
MHGGTKLNENIIHDLPSKWIVGFLVVYKLLMRCFIVFPFFSSIWRLQNIWPVVGLLRQNPHWLNPIISFAYGVKLESRMLDKILYLTEVIFLNNYYNPCYRPSYKWVKWPTLSTPQTILLIPNRITMFMNIRVACPPPCFDQFCWDLINNWWIASSYLFSSHLNLKRTPLRH